jgi:glycolate oxidase iron-sulfur subunit
MGTCLQCLACSSACPKGVDAAGIIRGEKTRLSVGEPGLPRTLERLSLALTVNSRHGLHTMTALLSRLQRLFPGNGSSTPRHLPLFLPEILAGRRVPPLSRGSVFAELPVLNLPGAGTRTRGSVTLFTGCFFGYASTAPVRSAVRVLRENGFQVRIPRNQTCCGAPALLGGHPDLARKTAVRNLEALRGPGPVITLCATCGSCLKNDYPELFSPGSREHARALDLSERTLDLHRFLAEKPGIRLGAAAVNRSVTVHDPCHLNRGLGVSAEMRSLLAKVPGLEIRDMDAPDACCGGGGLCALKNLPLSRGLGESKARAVVATGADLAAAPCPGCLLQIGDFLSRRGSGTVALHPAELLAMSFGPLP